MRYVKIDKYIVSLDCIHGVLHNTVGKRFDVIITYNGGVSASLEFKNIEESQKAFDKVAQLLGAE